MTAQAEAENPLQALELLASALAGRTVRVVAAPPGEASWTDGRTVFLGSALQASDQLLALCVQASMLSAGSLTPVILRQFKRNAQLASRYLAVEGRRALKVNEGILPLSVDHALAASSVAISTSAETSLTMARGKQPIPNPPAAYGVIDARRFLAAEIGGKPNADARAQLHKPKHQKSALTELEDDQDEDDGHDGGAAVEQFSIGGGAGFIGRWIQKLLKPGRRSGSKGGSPAGDAGTHRSRSMAQRGGRSVLSTVTGVDLEHSAEPGVGKKYPEWDMHSKSYRPDWCTVQELIPTVKDDVEIQPPQASSLRRPLARMALGLDRCRRQSQGDDIDIDAAIEAHIDKVVGATPHENLYVNTLKKRRDLSVLILLDISASTGQPGGFGQNVHEQQRAAAAGLASALHYLGDRVALYSYNSQGRTAVQLTPVMRFDEQFNSLVLRRLYSLVPGAYSRLGAAMRHGAAVLEKEGGTSRRLLLVISDGLAYDHGYERDYGAADARRALSEARRRGTACVCLTFGAGTETEPLRRVFGSAAYAAIYKPSQLAGVIGSLFHAALKSAEVKRRVA